MDVARWAASKGNICDKRHRLLFVVGAVYQSVISVDAVL